MWISSSAPGCRTCVRRWRSWWWTGWASRSGWLSGRPQARPAVASVCGTSVRTKASISMPPMADAQWAQPAALEVPVSWMNAAGGHATREPPGRGTSLARCGYERHRSSRQQPPPSSPARACLPATRLGLRPATRLGLRPATRLGLRPATWLGSRPAPRLRLLVCDAALASAQRPLRASAFSLRQVAPGESLTSLPSICARAAWCRCAQVPRSCRQGRSHGCRGACPSVSLPPVRCRRQKSAAP